MQDYTEQKAGLSEDIPSPPKKPKGYWADLLSEVVYTDSDIALSYNKVEPAGVQGKDPYILDILDNQQQQINMLSEALQDMGIRFETLRKATEDLVMVMNNVPMHTSCDCTNCIMVY